MVQCSLRPRRHPVPAAQEVGRSLGRGKQTAAVPASIGSLSAQDVNVADATVQVKNRLGLHLRAATTLAQAAAKFKSTITVTRGKDQASARSVTALIMLGAGKGTRLHIRAEGDDAQAAVTELTALFNDGFGEE